MFNQKDKQKMKKKIKISSLEHFVNCLTLNYRIFSEKGGIKKINNFKIDELKNISEEINKGDLYHYTKARPLNFKQVIWHLKEGKTLEVVILPDTSTSLTMDASLKVVVRLFKNHKIYLND